MRKVLLTGLRVLPIGISIMTILSLTHIACRADQSTQIVANQVDNVITQTYTKDTVDSFIQSFTNTKTPIDMDIDSKNPLDYAYAVGFSRTSTPDKSLVHEAWVRFHAFLFSHTHDPEVKKEDMEARGRDGAKGGKVYTKTQDPSCYKGVIYSRGDFKITPENANQ